MAFLELKPLTAEMLPAVVELDKLCFGGLWTFEGYQREIASPSSELLVLQLNQDKGNLAKGEKQTSHSGFNPEPMGTRGKVTPPLQSVDSTVLGIGCLWAIMEEAHITLLGIHPHYQNQGFGQTLLYALLKVSVDRGLERATLEVRVSNQAALSLYQKFGFQTAGRRYRYYQDNGEDAFILWRGDLQHPEFQQNLAIWHQQAGDRLRWCGWNLSFNSINPHPILSHP